MSMRRTIEHVGRNALQHQTKNAATQCRCLHDTPRNSRSQTWCPAVAKASLHWQRVYDKDPQKGKVYVDSWPLPERWGIPCKPATTLLEERMVQIFGLHQNKGYFAQSFFWEQMKRYATLFHFRYDPKQMERGPIKCRPDYHQTTRAVVSMNKEAGQTQESKKDDTITARI